MPDNNQNPADSRWEHQNLQLHPLANEFPLMDEAELKELADDIKKNGLIDPIAIYENKILDGRNRYKAANMVGYAFFGEKDFRFFDPEHDGDPLFF
jgi:hypothetical protein